MIKEKNNILISVVMPVYNSEKYLKEAIESVLNQTHKNFELVILDDGSYDNSLKIIKEYSKKDKRIKAFSSGINKGIPITRNILFKNIDKKSQYVTILDSDDVMQKNKLEIQLNFMLNNKKYVLVGSNMNIINENSEIVSMRKYPEHNEDILKIIGRKNVFAQSTIMFDRNLLYDEDIYYDYFDEEVYNNKYERCQDYDLWLRILKKYKGYNIQQNLINYRISKTQGKTKALKTTLKYTLQIQLEYLLYKKYFNIINIIYFFLEVGLFLLPNFIVLWLFKKMEYKKK